MKKQSFFTVVVTIGLIVLSSPAYAYVYSDYTWHSYNGHEYAITLYYNNWANAEAEAVAVGGHLATINDANKNSWLSQTFQGYYPQGYGGAEVSLVWIGFLLENDEWVWISGEPVTFPPPWYRTGPIHDSIHAYLHTDTHYEPGTWWEDPPYDGNDPYHHIRGIIELNPLTINQPNGGEVLTVGTTCTISWSSTGSISDVLIEYSIDNGSNWTLINTVPNTGSYDWLVPVLNSNQCLVRISDASDPNINDITNTVFTIFRQSVVTYVDTDGLHDLEPNNPDVSDPLEDGSVEHPFDAIQKAINAAYDGDTVIVLPGTYTGTGNRDIDFNGLAITIRSTEPNDPNLVAATVIDCNGSEAEPHRGFYFHSGEDSNSVLSGFTITGGYAEAGGGIYCDGVATKITKCLIYGNSADYGGGIYRRDTVSEVSNCIIRNNNALEGGGGYSYGDFYFIKGWTTVTVESFGRIWTFLIPVYGSGRFVNCVIRANSANKGGGIHYEGSVSEISNCTIVNNRADYGGGIHATSNSNTTTTNSILWGNTAANGNEIALADSSTINANYNDIQGEVAGVYSEPNCILNWGNGNIDADPLFADPNDNDYHLKSQAGRYDPTAQTWVQDNITSPCIDAGDPTSSIGWEMYPNGGVINMGAYGRTIEASKSYFGTTPCEEPIAGDVNGDCKVDYRDFAIMGSHWLEDNNP